MSDDAREISLAGIRYRHPDWNEPEVRRALVELLGDASLVADESLRTNAGRVASRERCVAAVQRVLRGAGADHWSQRCEAVGVPVGQVRTVIEALAEVDASPLTGVPSSVGGLIRRPPPRLGEHDDEIRRHGWG